MEMSPIFNELSSDVQESVRELAVENAVAIVKSLSPDEATKLFGTFVDNVQNETSRSMRIGKAKHFVSLAAAMHPVRPIRDQAQAFLRLMAIDNEIEVRNEASYNIAAYCARIDSATLLGQVLPVFRELSTMPQAAPEQEVFTMNQVRSAPRRPPLQQMQLRLVSLRLVRLLSAPSVETRCAELVIIEKVIMYSLTVV